MNEHPWLIAAAMYEHIHACEREPLFPSKPLVGYLDPAECYATAKVLYAFLHSEEGQAARCLLQAYGKPLVIVTDCQPTSAHPAIYVLTSEGPARADCYLGGGPTHPCTAEELIFAAMLQGMQPHELVPGIRRALNAIAEASGGRKHSRIYQLWPIRHRQTV